jgi:TolA-binding protein
MRNKVVLRGISILVLSVFGNAEISILGDRAQSYDLPEQSIESGSRSENAVIEQRLNQLNERVDGLTTVIEGLNGSINELRQMKSTLDEAEQRIRKLEAKIEFMELSGDSSSTTSQSGQPNASSSSLRTSASSSQSNLLSEQKDQSIDTEKSKSDEGGASMDGDLSSIYSEGVRLFQKKQYSQAKDRFAAADKKGYKSASSNYYLGEIAYYTQKYDDAIYYFKKSAGLNDKANYVDTLLLHTAIALEKTGDKTQAKVFYETIISNYSGKKTAKIASDNLKKL